MDDADRAKELEMRERQAALERTLAEGRETERPLVIGGVRCCIECGDPIPAARLAARPQSVRCTDCKQEREQRCRK
jgi:DnaK suppressor protein